MLSEKGDDRNPVSFKGKLYDTVACQFTQSMIDLMSLNSPIPALVWIELKRVEARLRTFL